MKRPLWPMIVLRSPKGWTCPKEIDGKRTEDYWRSHQVPMGDMNKKPEHIKLLETWMKSYKPEELFDKSGRPREQLGALIPQGERRMSDNPHGNGGSPAEGPAAAGLPRLRRESHRARRDSWPSPHEPWARSCATR